MKWDQRRLSLLGFNGPVFNKDDGAGDGAGDGGNNDDSDGNDTSENDDTGSNLQGGLLDRRGAGDQDKDDGDGDGDGDDGKKDDGRPDGLADKFWDAKKGVVRVDALAKSYADLEATHGKLKRGKAIGGEVPETAGDYFPDGLELGDDVDRLSVDGPDDPGLKAWGEVCHKRGIGKELAVDLAKDMFGMMNEYAPEPIDPDAEFEKLGKGGEAIVDGVFTWISAAESAGKLSEDDISVVNDLQQTAAGINFLVKMRAMSGEDRIPIVPSTGARGMSADQWADEMKQAVKDKNYNRQEELEAMDVGQKVKPGGYNI